MRCFSSICFLLVLSSQFSHGFHPSIVDEFTCHKCNSTVYCKSGQIFACPAHSTALEFAYDISHCICNDGYMRTHENTCVPGTPPYYYKFGLQKSCPASKETTRLLAFDIEHCVCVPGFKISSAQCAACEVGKYNHLFNQSSCFECPAFSYSSTIQSTSITFCKCNAGYSGDNGGQCVACEAGFYKSVSGNASCVGCPSNTYAANQGSVVCSNCTLHSTSVESSQASEACECNAGYEANFLAANTPHSCEPCSIGFFKSEIGNHGCEQCAVGKFSNTTQSLSCLNCKAHETSTQDRSRCVCNAGFFFSDAACTECASGTYKDVVGTEPCTLCLDVAHTSRQGSTAISECFCNAGYSGDQFECNECGAGFYKDFVSTSENYNCLSCPDNTTSNAASTSLLNCSCIAGHGAATAGVACPPCERGKFKIGVESRLCDLCEPDTFQNETGKTYCYSCQALSQSSAGSESIDDCVCISGAVRLPPLNDPSCSTCKAGKFATSSGCQNCSAGTFSIADGVTECSSCPLHGTSQYPFRSCVCLAGHYCAGMQASEPFNQQFTTVASSSMPDLISSHYYADWQNAVQWIDSNVVSDSNLISECDFSGKTYTEIVGILKNHPCPVQGIDGYETSGSLSSMLDCIVGIFDVNGVEVLGALLLFEHPSSPSSNGLKFSYYTSAEVASFLTLECMNSNALPIASSSVVSFSWGDESCADCLIRTNNDYSMCTICLCSDECLPCAANSYKNTTGTHGCTACQEDAQSPVASITVSACQCNTGFYQNGAHACLECADGKYSDTLDETSCSLCPFYHITPTVNAPYADITDCELCTFCAADHYVDVECAGSVDTICAPCREHSSTNLGYLEAPNFGNLSCACNAGYEFLEDRYICSECDYGFFKDTIQNTACLPCSANENTTAKASVDVDSCLCNFGFETIGASCTACSESKYKATLSDSLCLDCPENMNTDGAVASSYCVCSKGFQKLVSHTEKTNCTACEPGTFKNENSNNSCLLCNVGTFQNESAQSACKACPPNSGTYGESGSIKCTCDAGFEDTTNSYSCTACRDSFFKPSHTSAKCEQCSTCGSNERVKTQCNTTHDTVCQACQPNSVSPQNNSMAHCWCVDGYEFVDNACRACEVGTFKTGNSNNSVMCLTCPAGKVTEQVGSASCSTCRNTCPEGQFIFTGCSADRDTTCQNCTVCGSGYYANPVCGAHHLSFKNDTNCSVCPANFFCANNAITPCMANAHGEEQSSLLADCVCNDGYYRSDPSTCAVCGYDSYCNDDTQNTCPEYALTLSEVASDISDCNCQHGYYRVWNDANTEFTCMLCQENDWCFDNNAYNCSDARMSSVRGSSSQSSCICQNGWYNAVNDTICLICPAGYFCVDGSAFSCNDDTLYIAENATSAGNLWLQHRWTQNKTGASSVYDCMCVAGQYGVVQIMHTPITHVAEICVDCTLNSYCIGNNLQESCPENTSSPMRSTRAQDCVCAIAYGVENSNSTACRLCAEDTFKVFAGNSECTPCTSCKSSEFIASECLPNQNRICSNCDACDDGDIFTEFACTSIADAICSNCTVCDYSNQYASPDCSSAHNRVCNNITRSCNTVGFYAGHHTRTSNRECRPCRVTSQAYYGTDLHLFTSSGSEYGNAFSCNITCVPGSALIDANNVSRGCRTCEEGNVLLKRFPPQNVNSDQCNFECIAPYVRVDNDCRVSALSNDRSLLLHITQIQYLSDRLWLNVLHSSFGHYIILVGKRTTKCTRQNIMHVDQLGCCYHDLFRVSSLTQMGRLAEEQCSMRPLLTSTRADDSVTNFEIEDSMLGTVANCSTQHGSQTCSFYITLLDLITGQNIFKKVQIHKRRSYVFTYLNTENEYIPLSSFKAEVQLAFILSSGEKVYRVFWKTTSSQHLNIEVRVRGMTFYTLDDNEKRLCSRIAQEPHDSNSTNFSMPSNTMTRSLTYWRGSGVMVHVLIALQSDANEIMDIAVLRNMSSLPAQCVQEPSVVHYAAGNVFVGSGLGRNVIYSLHLHDTSEIPTTHGKLGNLRTFMAVSATDVSTTISLKRVLAVHLLHPTVYDDPMVQWSMGSPEFVYSFQIWCLQNTNCEYEYISAFDDTLFEMSNCSATTQQLARNWINAQFGTASDAGHISAVCNRMQDQSNNAKTFLVHAMRHSHTQVWEPRSLRNAQTYLWAPIQFIT